MSSCSRHSSVAQLIIMTCNVGKVSRLRKHSCMWQSSTHCSTVQPQSHRAQCYSAKHADSSLVSQQLHLCYWPFIHSCRWQSPRHRSTVQDRMPALWLSAALENMLTTALCHRDYTYESCSERNEKWHALLFRVVLEIKLTAALCDHAVTPMLI